MGMCEVCGNEYDKSFTIIMDKTTHEFDSFECAIHQLAPECMQCGMRVIGHGVESNGQIYCCANCARMRGIQDISDRHDDAEAI